MSERLPLYEASVREPVAYMDEGGTVTNTKGARVEKVPDAPGYFKRNGEGNPEPSDPLPCILFGGVKEPLHLECGLSVAPFSKALSSER